MSTQYIVKFIKNNEDKNSESIDSFAELSKTLNNSYTITVRTHKDSKNDSNQILLYKFITNNFANVEFDDIKKICYLTYSGKFDNTYITSLILFDDNGASAYSDFKKNLEIQLNSNYITINYKSGNIRYNGEVINHDKSLNYDSKYNGKGTEYYDTINNYPKYSGEYENGLYDGSGTFYGFNNKVHIIVNNISNGIPTQKGKLYINFDKMKDVINLEFTSEFWDKFNIYNKNSKQEFVKSNTFVNEIVHKFWNKQYISELVFMDKSINEKYFELYQELDFIKNQLKETNELNRKLVEKSTKNINESMLTVMFVNFVTVVLVSILL